MDFNIGFIGFGLIGGSIARGIKKINTEKLNRESCFYERDFHITAYNYHKKPNDSLTAAKKDGNIDAISEDIRDFKNMDLIFLCAPVMTNINYLRELKPIISHGCILTDVGSVKNDIQKAVDSVGLSANFIGGHPMAGTEFSGYENSSEKIIEGAYYILTLGEKTADSSKKLMEELISLIKAKAVILDSREHDELVAAISHLPHLVAASLVDLVRKKDAHDNMKLLAAGGFKDITRIASSSPVMWRDICISNKESILFMLREYIEDLKQIEKSLEEDRGEDIYSLFERSGKYRNTIPDK